MEEKKIWALDTNENGFKSHVFLLFDLEKYYLIPNFCFLSVTIKMTKSILEKIRKRLTRKIIYMKYLSIYLYIYI